MGGGLGWIDYTRAEWHWLHRDLPRAAALWLVGLAVVGARSVAGGVGARAVAGGGGRAAAQPGGRGHRVPSAAGRAA